MLNWNVCLRMRCDRNQMIREWAFGCEKAADIFANTIKRDPNASVAIPEDIPGKEFRQKSYEEIMAELDEFVGIDEIKATVQKIINKIDFERERKGAGAKREVKDHFCSLVTRGRGRQRLPVSLLIS